MNKTDLAYEALESLISSLETLRKGIGGSAFGQTPKTRSTRLERKGGKVYAYDWVKDPTTNKWHREGKEKAPKAAAAPAPAAPAPAPAGSRGPVARMQAEQQYLRPPESEEEKSLKGMVTDLGLPEFFAQAFQASHGKRGAPIKGTITGEERETGQRELEAANEKAFTKIDVEANKRLAPFMEKMKGLKAMLAKEADPDKRREIENAMAPVETAMSEIEKGRDKEKKTRENQNRSYYQWREIKGGSGQVYKFREALSIGACLAVFSTSEGLKLGMLPAFDQSFMAEKEGTQEMPPSNTISIMRMMARPKGLEEGEEPGIKERVGKMEAHLLMSTPEMLSSIEISVGEDLNKLHADTKKSILDFTREVYNEGWVEKGDVEGLSKWYQAQLSKKGGDFHDKQRMWALEIRHKKATLDMVQNLSKQGFTDSKGTFQAPQFLKYFMSDIEIDQAKDFVTTFGRNASLIGASTLYKGKGDAKTKGRVDMMGSLLRSVYAPEGMEPEVGYSREQQARMGRQGGVEKEVKPSMAEKWKEHPAEAAQALADRLEGERWKPVRDEIDSRVFDDGKTFIKGGKAYRWNQVIAYNKLNTLVPKMGGDGKPMRDAEGRMLKVRKLDQLVADGKGDEVVKLVGKQLDPKNRDELHGWYINHLLGPKWHSPVKMNYTDPQKFGDVLSGKVDTYEMLHHGVHGGLSAKAGNNHVNIRLMQHEYSEGAKGSVSGTPKFDDYAERVPPGYAPGDHNKSDVGYKALADSLGWGYLVPECGVQLYHDKTTDKSGPALLQRPFDRMMRQKGLYMNMVGSPATIDRQNFNRGDLALQFMMDAVSHNTGRGDFTTAKDHAGNILSVGNGEAFQSVSPQSFPAHYLAPIAGASLVELGVDPNQAVKALRDVAEGRHGLDKDIPGYAQLGPEQVKHVQLRAAAMADWLEANGGRLPDAANMPRNRRGIVGADPHAPVTDFEAHMNKGVLKDIHDGIKRGDPWYARLADSMKDTRFSHQIPQHVYEAVLGEPHPIAAAKRGTAK